MTSPPVGTTATVGEVSLQVLGPVDHPIAAEDESSAQNDESLVVMITAHGLRLLLTGDVEPPGQAAILGSGADLRADVLKVPHHGSARQDPAFFAATGARLAIASAGLDNDYGHPAPRTVQLINSLGMTLLRTDQQGSVAITSDGRPARRGRATLVRPGQSQAAATGKRSGPRSVVPGRMVKGSVIRIAGKRSARARNAWASSIRASGDPRQ